MDGKMLARVGAVVFVAFALTATAIEMTREEEQPRTRPTATRATAEVPVDPLREQLIRCQALGQAASGDRDCSRAWAENRRRFLAPGARPMERLPDPPASPAQQEQPAPGAQ